MVVLFASMGFAWNCPSGQIRQQAPAGTPTSAPFYDVVEGIAFICVPNTPPPSMPSTQTQNQTQSQTQQQNQQQNATATSTSNSTSGAHATGGNSIATGGSATGGKVSDSGNSSNTNTNVAEGGKGGQGGKGGNAAISGSGNSSQTQSSVSSATGNGVGNGNNSNNYASSTVVEAPKIPVNTAFAPSQFPTVGCYKTYSGGAQTQAFGISLGGGKIDKNCAILEAAGRARNILAYCKVYITDKYVHEAGVTLEDCMHQEQVAAVLPPPIVAAPVPQPVLITVQTETNQPAPVTAPVLAGTCATVSNVCKAMLDDAINWHKQNDGTIVVYGSLTTYRVANAMRQYLNKNGVPNESIRVEMSSKSSAEVGFAYLQ